MPDTTGDPPRASGRRQLRVHDEHWAGYVLTGLAGLFSGLSLVLRALDEGPWLCWLFAALAGLVLVASTGVLVSIRRRGRGVVAARSWTRPA